MLYGWLNETLDEAALCLGEPAGREAVLVLLTGRPTAGSRSPRGMTRDMIEVRGAGLLQESLLGNRNR